MACSFCCKWQEKEEYKYKVILDFGDMQIVIYSCEDCLKKLNRLLQDKYIGRDLIAQEFDKLNKIE